MSSPLGSVKQPRRIDIVNIERKPRFHIVTQFFRLRVWLGAADVKKEFIQLNVACPLYNATWKHFSNRELLTTDLTKQKLDHKAKTPSFTIPGKSGCMGEIALTYVPLW